MKNSYNNAFSLCVYQRIRYADVIILVFDWKIPVLQNISSQKWNPLRISRNNA